MYTSSTTQHSGSDRSIPTWLFRCIGLCLLFLAVTLTTWACGGPAPGSGGDLNPDDQVRVLNDPETTGATEGSANTEANTSKEPGAASEPSTALEPNPATDAGPEPTPSPDTTPAQDVAPDTTRPPEPSGPLSSWIGGPCRSTSDCNYTDAVCLTDTQGYPQGTCSQACTRLCPDREGTPSTFCVNLQDKITGNAGCISQCDFNLFPQGGCRSGYHCEQVGRYREGNVQRNVCLPGPPTKPSGSCYQQLLDLGVNFVPGKDPQAKPEGFPNLTCSVTDALTLQPPIMGVDWVSGANKRVGMFMRCELALAVVKLSQYLKQRGIAKVMHFGTYNCRTIRTDSGSTASLSQHGLGRAVDIAAFWDNQGKEFNLVKHWDHSTTWKNSQNQTGCWSTQFNSPEAKVLYDIACDMWKQKIFSLVLTPNYNNAHDNHYHVDLSGNGNVLSKSSAEICSHHGH